MSFTLRAASPDDAEALSTLAKRSFTETFGSLYSPENLAAFLTGHSPDHWRSELCDPRFAVQIGEVGAEPVAYAKIGPPSLPFEPRGRPLELRQIYVLKPWQGTGAAAALMQWAIEEARGRGADELYLSVFIDNPRARRFYDRYGFEAVGRYAFMVGSHADEDLVMRKAL